MELRRLQTTTSDAAKKLSMQEAIDNLQEMIDCPIMEDSDSETDAEPKETRAADVPDDKGEQKPPHEMVVATLLSPLSSPQSQISQKPRPMSARPQSARRRSVPNLNVIPEEWRLRSSRTKESADSPSGRRPRNSISHTPRAASQSAATTPTNASAKAAAKDFLASAAAATAVEASAVIAAMQYATAAAKAECKDARATEGLEEGSAGESKKGEDKADASTTADASTPSRTPSRTPSPISNRRVRSAINSPEMVPVDASTVNIPELQTFSLPAGFGSSYKAATVQLDYADGYSSSESVSSVNSRDGPLARKKKSRKAGGRASHGVLGGLDDVIEETTVNIITNEATTDERGLTGSVTALSWRMVAETFCTSGDTRTTIPLINAPWIPTGLFPQCCFLTLKINIKVSRVVVECSGVRRMRLEVVCGGHKTDYASPVLPPSGMGVKGVRHTEYPSIDIMDTPRARKGGEGGGGEGVETKLVWKAGHLGVGHNPQPGVVKVGDNSSAWVVHTFNLGHEREGQNVRDMCLVVEEAHETENFVVLRNLRIYGVDVRTGTKARTERKVGVDHRRGSRGGGGGGGGGRSLSARMKSQGEA